MIEFSSDVSILAGVGAIAGEVAHWYHLRSQLPKKKYKMLLQSSIYWMVTIVMIFVGAITIGLMFPVKEKPQAYYLLFGVGFPLILKKAGSIIKASKIDVLGDEDEFNPISEYFT